MKHRIEHIAFPPKSPILVCECGQPMAPIPELFDAHRRAYGMRVNGNQGRPVRTPDSPAWMKRKTA